MAISYRSIRSDRQWRAATGLTQQHFNELTFDFSQTYEDFHGSTLKEQIDQRSDDPKFKTYEDILFFILYSLKSGLTYDLLALSFDMSRSVTFEKQAFGTRLLQMTFQKNGHLPRRQFKSFKEIEQYLDEYDELIIDGTEQQRQRPVNQDDQKDDYSGKKKLTQ